ncbi:hypothetical protein KY290_021161 [Solanum tuberosum]|uniref:MADS-box domain-containing protein n=1 Tax=Solanum tuberosum TaxID=4113 RepID=A0ABQ7V0Q7_SOLTU|nr:hypothetical protein KY289_022390 [Solanum tuberosum]KAH0692997.1 hypothetical protein KY285_020094 [Solanum tuberosum]KAH0757668.1 hypothetical protein KY290_021161 [Solanum tuberosum]
MPRNKVKFVLIENENDRKVSYKKREKGFLTKAEELRTLCDVEMAAIFYSPFNNEPKVFPHHGAAITTFEKLVELPTLKKSKNMVTSDEFTKKRIEKLNEKLLKVRKKNKVKEVTNEMYEMLKGKEISIDMNPYDLNDLSYVIKQKLIQVSEAMKKNVCEQDSTSNVPQSFVGPMIPGGTNIEGSKASVLPLTSFPLSIVPLLSPLTILGGTYFERREDSLFTPNVAPIRMPQEMFHQEDPLRTPFQEFPLVDPSQFPASPLSFSHMFPPMVPQLFSPLPQHMDFSVPSTTMDSPIPLAPLASLLSAPVCSPMTSQMDPARHIPPMGVLMPMNNYKNYSLDIPESLSFSELLNWINGEAMTLLEDPSLNDINVKDLKNTNNN